MIIVKCTYYDSNFYTELVDLCETFDGVTTQGFDMNYSDSSKKGRLKCKSAFSAKKDPFVGIWINDIPRKGFYSEANECTIDNIKLYLNSLSDEEFERSDPND